MTRKHADLSPSAAERWLSCPASVRMTKSAPETESVYAREGTAAHELAALMAQHTLLGLSAVEFDAEVSRWREEYADVITEEMTGHCEQYVEYLLNLRNGHAEPHLLLEQRLPTGLPGCWGTSDAVVVSPTLIDVVDLKYGKGVAVEARGNPQLRLYGIGALEAFGDLLGEVEKVRLTIYQPRIHNVTTEEIAAVDLRAWRDSIIPIAEQALGPDAPFGPSESACRWCSVSGSCKAQQEHFARMDFGVSPELLDDGELSSVLGQLKHIEHWCAAVRDYALDLAYSQGHTIPGWKVVLSGGRRSITNPTGALEALQLLGYPLEQVANIKPKGIGELEKILQDDFDVALGQFVARGESSPSLVPDEGERPGVTPEIRAAKDFT